MSFNTGAALLDAIVLAVVGREETGTYGYRITQDVRAVLDISESTLYPVLRRLQKDGCLTVHDELFNGRNRRYYQITPTGRAQLGGGGVFSFRACGVKVFFVVVQRILALLLGQRGEQLRQLG